MFPQEIMLVVRKSIQNAFNSGGRVVNILTILIVLAMLMTIAVLFAGIRSMAHGGEFDKKHSTEFMFARVAMQAVTVLLRLFAVYLANA